MRASFLVTWCDENGLFKMSLTYVRVTCGGGLEGGDKLAAGRRLVPEPTPVLTKERDTRDRDRPDAWSRVLHASLQEGAAIASCSHPLL